MKDFEQFRQEFEDWVINTVSIPNPLKGNFPPCPYAKAAWLDNRVSLRQFHGPELIEILMEQPKVWNDEFEMIIFGCDPKNLDAQTLEKYIADANEVLPEYDLIALSSHPDKVANKSDTDDIKDVFIGNPKYAVSSVQRLSKLREASDKLFKLGFYEYWSEEKLADALNERNEMLQKFPSKNQSN
ncbi:MAG: hypothetical protein AAFP10_08665 [Pseudomonadota bacterium]